jgi:hypothetical protein
MVGLFLGDPLHRSHEVTPIGHSDEVDKVDKDKVDKVDKVDKDSNPPTKTNNLLELTTLQNSFWGMSLPQMTLRESNRTLRDNTTA